MADKIIAHVSQDCVGIMVSEPEMVQKVINVMDSLTILFHFELEVVYEDDVEKESREIAHEERHEVRHGNLPQELGTDEARRVLDGLVDIHVLDADYQPLDLSWSQRGYLAKWIADKLGIFHVWKVMGELWHLDSKASRRALRSGYNKALELGITGDLIDKLKLID